MIDLYNSIICYKRGLSQCKHNLKTLIIYKKFIVTNKMSFNLLASLKIICVVNCFYEF